MDRFRRILSFVSSLVSYYPQEGFRNPYSQPEAAHNLLVFLSRRDHLERAILLVGEAPGYRGAAVSGVAFTSLAILTDGWGDPWDSFGTEKGYQAPEPVPYRSEATATMVWGALAENFSDGPIPLTWNAVPFHPFGAKPDSNRPLPSNAIDAGRHYLEDLMDLFPNVQPVAVGRRACEALDCLAVEHASIRHPSRGGKHEFVSGLISLRDDYALNGMLCHSSGSPK
jgi:hypothetical protein